MQNCVSARAPVQKRACLSSIPPETEIPIIKTINSGAPGARRSAVDSPAKYPSSLPVTSPFS